tara:strand:- start:1886 stop:2584 length:699 start_codon:yes stop_codon:yes gene_type:complete
MDVNTFNKLAEQVNRDHLHSLFGLKSNRSSIGIDLIDPKRKVALELKGAIRQNIQDNPQFKIGVHQIYKYPEDLKGYQLFWAFMSFELKKQISEITPDTIENSIGKREIWLFEWDYIHTFTAFDEEIYTTFGANGYNTLFRFLGFSNSSTKKRKERASDLQRILFEDLKEIHPPQNLVVLQNQLHIRPDKISQIGINNSIIYFDVKYCNPLLEAYLDGPYKMDLPEQVNLKF